MKRNLPTFLLLTFSFLFHTFNAFDITQLLAQHPSLTTFSHYIDVCELPRDINTRHTITVLAVDNHAMQLLNGKPVDVMSKILKLHVLLDYYDMPKLQNLPNKTAIVPTLFQASGLAKGDQGMLKITKLGTNSIVFSSGPSGGSGPNVRAYAVTSMDSMPYDISILQISNLIVPPGIIDGPNATNSNTNLIPPPAATPPASSLAPAPPHGNSPNVSTPLLAKAPAPSPTNVSRSLQHPNAPTLSHANAPGSPQRSNALVPSHENDPGSPHPTTKAPTPSHAIASGSPHHANGPSSSETDGSTSPSHVDGPDLALVPVEVPDETSYGVRITSSINLSVVLVIRLLLLALSWMV